MSREYASKPPYDSLWQQEVRGISVIVPEAVEFGYYDGWHLWYFEAEKPFDCDTSETGLRHDAAFAAVASAAWRMRCSKAKECQCQCTCTQCVLAHAWQKVYEKVMSELEAK
jgi:hypothetical protein